MSSQPLGKRGLPFVFVNMAMTADGKIATANRRVVSFGSPYDQDHLLRLRAQADAVMVGAGTVNAQPINLGPGPAQFRRLRLKQGRAEYNLRIIVSGTGSVDPGAEVFRHHFSPTLVLVSKRISRTRLKNLKAVAEEVKICGDEEIDFRRTLRWLKKDWGVERLLCEGGGEVNAALFAADLVDELHLTLCPRIFGGRQAPTISEGRGVARLADATRLDLRSIKRVRDELYLTYRVL
jgi:riboflavin-specific deaminase-like protein